MDKLQVIIEDLTNNRRCFHGPTLKFVKTNSNEDKIEEFYACSAFRDKKVCSKNEKHENINHFDSYKLFREISVLKPKQRVYCRTCNTFVLQKKVLEHTNHDFVDEISDQLLKEPTKLLHPLSVDKKEAQYFFSNDCLEFFGNTFKKLGLNKIICIGSPRLHEFLKNNFQNLGIKSILLDLDKRFFSFYGPDEFCWYNMFNHWFFNSSEPFNKFLKEDINEKTCLITDPPFGCRTEPLIQTLKRISQEYQQINSTCNVLSMMWVFPYFMETYITNLMPEMEMSDYKINYTNHELYRSKNGRKEGSPVRFLTNISLSLINLPKSEGYKFCKPCNKDTAIENHHCKICSICPSKNGSTYIHCKKCRICVKSNYEHCDDCGRCAQRVDHECEMYQKNLTCWICKKKGHTERNCQRWLKTSGKGKFKKRRICLICSGSNHNEKNCPKRDVLLKESYFLNEVTNIFS